VFTINRALYHYKPGFIIPTRNQHVVDVHAVVVNVFVASVLPKRALTNATPKTLSKAEQSQKIPKSVVVEHKIRMP